MRYTDQLRALAQLIEDEALPVPLQVSAYGVVREVTTVSPRTEEREPWLELCESIRETETNADTWLIVGVVNVAHDFKFEVHATWSAPPCVDPACPHHGTPVVTETWTNPGPGNVTITGLGDAKIMRPGDSFTYPKGAKWHPKWHEKEKPYPRRTATGEGPIVTDGKAIYPVQPCHAYGCNEPGNFDGLCSKHARPVR